MHQDTFARKKCAIRICDQWTIVRLCLQTEDDDKLNEMLQGDINANGTRLLGRGAYVNRNRDNFVNVEILHVHLRVLWQESVFKVVYCWGIIRWHAARIFWPSVRFFILFPCTI